MATSPLTWGALAEFLNGGGEFLLADLLVLLCLRLGS